MAAEPDTQHQAVATSDGAHEHEAGHGPSEKPSDWGWHADFGKPARIAGWAVCVILLLMITSTHYNGAGAVALISTTAILVIGLLWDINRRRTSWRD